MKAIILTIAILTISTSADEKLPNVEYECGEGSFEGNLLLQIEEAELNTCQLQCTKLEECGNIVFDDKKTCSIIGKDGIMTTETGTSIRCEKRVLTVKSQPTFECHIDSEVSTAELFQIEQVGSVPECQEFCIKQPVCRSITFTKDSACILKDAADIASIVTVKGSTFCVRTDIVKDVPVLIENVNSDFTCRQGTYDGQELFYVENVATLAACQKYCEWIDGCTSLSYDADTCSLYNNFAIYDTSSKKITCTRVRTLNFNCAEGMKFSNTLFTIGGISTLEECQRQCTTLSLNDVCKGVNYGGDKSCELVETITAVEPSQEFTGCAVNVPVTSSTDEKTKPKQETQPESTESLLFQCTSNTAFKGEDLISFGNVKNLIECQSHCVNVNSCSSFSYNSDECRLLSNNIKITTTPEPQTLSCKKGEFRLSTLELNPVKYTCKNTTLLGGDLKILSNVEELFCKEMCTSLSECFTYMALQSVCVLKSNLAVESDSPQAISGISCTKNSEGQHPNPSWGHHYHHEIRKENKESIAVDQLFTHLGKAVFSGKALKVMKRASKRNCAAQCHVIPECEYFAFGDDVCHLISSSSAITEDLSSSNTVWKRFTENSIDGYECTKGSFIGGTLSAIMEITTPRECTDECRKVIGCSIAVHHSGDSRCMLKALHATPSRGVELSTACVSNKVTTTKDDYQCSKDVSYGEGSISLVEGVKSIAACRAHCNEISECAIIQYMSSKSACELKSRLAIPEGYVHGVISCSNNNHFESSRSVQTLAEEVSTELISISYVNVKVSFRIDNLTPAVWGTLALPQGTSSPTALSVVSRIRTPVGMDPVLYSKTAYHAVITELSQRDSIFMSKLNPTLKYLGLASLGSEKDVTWSVESLSHEWTNSPAYVAITVGIPLLNPEDYTDSDQRMELARRLSVKTGEPASLISFLDIFMCDVEGNNCELIWTAATQDTTGGRKIRSQSRGDIIKARTTFDIPDGHTAHTYCTHVASEVVTNQFGWQAVTGCDSYRGNTVDDAPGDAPADTQSISGRRLLEVTKSKKKRTIKTQQSATGTEDGHRRTCSDGWQTSEYGVMSNSFNINENSEFTGTLTECIDRCTELASCFAFSRDVTISAIQQGTCWFKKTVLPAVGDQHKHDNWGTYVVSCPPDLDPCKWYHMDNVDASGPDGTEIPIKPIVTSSECSALCELMPDCVAISYKENDHSCKFVRSLPNRLLPSSGVESSVCYRASATRTPCDGGICGVHPSNACFPVLDSGGIPNHRCMCAEGFQCEGKCDSDAAHNCIRSGISLQRLFIEGMTKTIGVDKHAITSTPEVISVTDSSIIEQQNVITISSSKLYIPTTHTISITLSKTDVASVLVNDKLSALKTEISNGLDLSESEVTVKSLCSILDGEVIACYDEEQSEIPIISKPVIRMSPTNNWESGNSWCKLDSRKLACPKSTSELEQLVSDSAGEIVETRTYWAGARCTAEDCADPTNWFWEDTFEVVAWDSLAYENDLQTLKNRDCAIFKWDQQHIRWTLSTAPCNSRKSYPVCQDTSESEPEHADDCNAGSCNLRVSFDVDLQHLRTIYFYTLPKEETIQRYYPTVVLPAGTKIVDVSGKPLGYVDTVGKTSAIPYPAVDVPVNSVLHSLQGSYTYVSEMLIGWVQNNVADWLENAGLSPTDYNGACHVLLTQKHVKCENICELVEPLLYQRSSCKGAPPCNPSACSNNGRVKGFIGHCTCTCDHGFKGTDCGQCAPGHVGYPQCSGPDEIIFEADPLYEVFHMFASSGKSTVMDGINDLRSSLKSALSDISDFVVVEYICPISTCAEGTICRDSLIIDWPIAKQNLCTYVDTERDLTTLDGSVLWMDTAESVIEVRIKFTASASSNGVAVTDAALLRLQKQSFPYQMSGIQAVYGPSITPPKDSKPQLLTPEDETAVPPVDDRGAAGTEDGILVTKEVINWVPVYAMAAGTFVCILLMIGLYCYKVRQRKQEHTTSGEDIYEKYGDIPDDNDSDMITIYKEADEPMGILWDDHTLCIDVVRGSPASRYNVDRFTQRRIAKVNNMRVTRLSEIKEAVEGKTVVVLEFEPRSVSLTVCLSTSVEDFHEPSFLKQFAAKVSSSLDLENFTPADVDIQSVVANFEGDTDVTMNLTGLTASQVATVSRLCQTPGTNFQTALGISGATMGKGSELVPKASKKTSNNVIDNGSDNPLWICCQWVAGAAEAAGCYIQSLQLEGGLPVWHFNSEPLNHYVYSTVQGYWVVVNNKELIGRDLTNCGYIIRSKKPHQGVTPHFIKEWVTVEGSEDADSHIIVSATQPRTKDFFVGQRVVFPTHLELEDGIVIAKRSEGIVMGETGDELVKVFLLNEAGDYVTVSYDAIDSPDGPKCAVWKTCTDGNSQWMGATIVKVRNRLVKVHYDCGYCEDEWIDIEAQANDIRLTGVVQFSVGDHVQLEASYEPTQGDSIKKREPGTIVSIGEGIAKPYLVEGKEGSAWYAAVDLVLHRPVGNVPAAMDITESHNHDYSTVPSNSDEQAALVGQQGTMYEATTDLS